MAINNQSTATSRTILLVEDHPDIGEIMVRFLSMWKYDTHWAKNFAEAQELAATQQFDVLVSDLKLPDGSGLDLMRAVQAINPRIKGVALSGLALDEDLARSQAAGFATHLTKPINMEKLRGVLRELAPPDTA